jgi:hypothetical protein
MARARKKLGPQGARGPVGRGPGAAGEGAAAPGVAETGRVARALKWVAGVTAVLTLVFGLVQATTLVSGRVERGRRVRELLQVARQQLAMGDHQAAWSSAAAAGAVDARSADVRRTQEDVAMAWLRDASVRAPSPGAAAPPGPRAGAVLVDPLAAALDRGLVDATGARRADLLAHRGWADFLRARDGAAQRRDPARLYGAAVEADARNPYAHAMWGHWVLWEHGPPGEARAHFAAAIAGGRERAYVRGLQLAARRNDGSPESEAEALRVADAIRREGGAVDAAARRHIQGAYSQRMRDSAGRAALLAALPPDAHLATYRWLFAEELRDSTREPGYRLYLAQLQEYAGDSAGALAAFRRLRAEGIPWAPRERAIVDAAIARGGARRR